MLHIGSVDGTIERRLLVNFRVQPEALRRYLPSRFEPQLISGWAMAGICLMRLSHLRPIGIPAFCGTRSQNAAHRIAVTWTDGHGPHHGVYIPRRDTDSLVNQALGGRFFPGVHHRARFMVEESESALTVAMRSLDGTTSVAVTGRPARELPEDSIFGSLDQASEFFKSGSLGYSTSSRCDCHDGLQLLTDRWRVEPLDVANVQSSFFGERRLFPPGSVEFDSALLMHDIPCRWPQPPLMAAA